jgi:Homeodomain-like domain
VIGWALLAAASGIGCTEIGRQLGRSVATVRGWVNRFAVRAERVRQVFTVLLVELDSDPPVLDPAGSPVADAVAAIDAAARATARRWSALVSTVSRWELACAVTSGTLLAPSIVTGSINTNHIL